MSETFDIQQLVESSRTASAPMHADMDVANVALDFILSAGSKGEFSLWDAIDEQIGKAEAPGLKERLIALRVRFVEKVVADNVARLETVFTRSPDEGWKAWQTTLAEAIANFRTELGIPLCERAFPFQGHEGRARELTKAVRWIRQGRWPEAYEQIEKLAREDFLPVATGAKLLVILGEIQMFHFSEFGTARELLDAAHARAPDDARVLGALGDYWAKKEGLKKDLPMARSYYDRAIEIAPGSSNSYVGMGDSFKSEGDLKSAEQWYLKAIASASGEAASYESLLQLYGRPELFRQHEAELLPLTQRAIAVSPYSEYRMYVTLGDAYLESNQERARSWYNKAIALDGTDPRGYAALAASYEKSGSQHEAEGSYKRAIEVAPECYDGYWGLTWLYEQQGRWQDALEWYGKCPLYREEWAGIVRAKIGEMHAKLENYRDAEDILKHELRADHGNQSAKNILHAIADDYYRKRGDRNAAMRVYEEILDILQDSYRADYHNRIGNLNSYYGENEQAAAQYRRAITADPDDAVYHMNLAIALRDLKQFDQAAQELEFARDRDHSVENFAREIALLANAEANDSFVRGDYRKAIDGYTRAIEHDPGDAVFHSNMAGAWEELKETGRRMEALDKAIEAFGRAQAINPNGGYAIGIERVGRKREIVLSYGEKALDWLHAVTPIVIEVAGNLIPHVEGSAQNSLSDETSKHIGDMRRRIQDRFGVRIPGVRIRGNEADLPDGSYVIMLMEIPVVSGNILPDQRFFNGTQQVLSTLGVTGREARHPLTDEDGYWVGQDESQRIEAAGLELWSAMQYLFAHLEAVIRSNLAEFLGHDEVANLLEATSSKGLSGPHTRPENRAALTTVCRALVAEEVSIGEFPAICEAFDRGCVEGAGLQDIVESIRALPLFGPRLPGNEQKYAVLPFGPRYEAGIRRAIYESDSHAVLAMEPKRCQEALTALRNEAGVEDRHLALMVHDPALRPFVRRLIELEFPHIPVLSRLELRTDAKLETERRIELDDHSAPAKPVGRSFDPSAARLDQAGTHAVPEDTEIAITAFVHGAFAAEQASADFPSMFSMMQDGLFYELGVVLPKVSLEVDSNLSAGEFRFRLNGRDHPPVKGLERDEFLVNDTVDRLALLNIKGRKADNPANDSECAIVREQSTQSKTCQDAGLTVWGPADFLVLALSAAIRKNAAAFQTAHLTKYILESLRAAFPALLDAALQRFTLEQICLVLRSLLEEEISIRDMRSILESLLAINGTTDVDANRYIVFAPYAEQLCPVVQGTKLSDLTTCDYSSFVRASLKRYISHKYTRGGNTLVVFLLSPEIEERIGAGAAHPLSGEERTHVKQAVTDELGKLSSTAKNPVLLTTTDARRPIRKLLEADFPNLAVVSYQELSPDLNIQALARISWSK